MQTRQQSALARTVAETATDIWNDSCAVDELEYAISFGAVGATANPTIVVDNWKKDAAHWADRTRSLALEQPAWTELELAWAIVEEMSVRGAKLLEPAFAEHNGRQGRLWVQTNPTYFRVAEPMLAQAIRFAGLAPNIIVKFRATAARYRGLISKIARFKRQYEYVRHHPWLRAPRWDDAKRSIRDQLGEIERDDAGQLQVRCRREVLVAREREADERAVRAPGRTR